MRNRGGIQLESEIRRRKLRHLDIEKMVGAAEGSGLVTRLVSGERAATMKQAATFERELGIPMASWTIPVEDESETGPAAA